MYLIWCYFIYSRQQHVVEVTKTDTTNDVEISHSTSTLQSETEESLRQKKSMKKQQVYFEGLPNFIAYGEDTKV